MGVRRVLSVGVTAVAVAALLVFVGGCGGSTDRSEPPPDAATTSVGERRVAPDAAPPVEPISEAELRTRLDEAVARSVGGDPCPLYGVVESVVPDLSTPASARRAYRVIRSALVRTEASGELEKPWSTLIEAVGREVEEAASGAAFAGAEVRRALDALDAACRVG